MSPRMWLRALRIRRNRKHVAPYSPADLRELRDESPRPFGQDGR
ncbi:hypothetical protein AB0F72_09465 [Actinoplanes sp. NPDC023936]